MGRVFFTTKSGPVVDWSEIESRLQGISAPPSTAPSGLIVRFETSSAPEALLPVETLACHLPLANDPPVTGDQPVITSSDLLAEKLSLLSKRGVSRSFRQDIPEFREATGPLLRCVPNRLARSIVFGSVLTNI